MVSVSTQNRFSREFCERAIKSFMDVIVLRALENGGLLSGYDVIALVHKRFHFLVSSGTVYSLLYSMERDGLIEGAMTSKKRVYRLTDKGREKLESALEMGDEICLLMKSVLGQVKEG